MRVEQIGHGNWVRATSKDGSNEWITQIVPGGFFTGKVVRVNDDVFTVADHGGQILAFSYSRRDLIWTKNEAERVKSMHPSRDGMKIFVIVGGTNRVDP